MRVRSHASYDKAPPYAWHMKYKVVKLCAPYAINKNQSPINHPNGKYKTRSTISAQHIKQVTYGLNLINLRCHILTYGANVSTYFYPPATIMKKFKGWFRWEFFKFPRTRRLFPRRRVMFLRRRRLFQQRRRLFSRRMCQFPRRRVMFLRRRRLFLQKKLMSLNTEGVCFCAANVCFHGTCAYFNGEATCLYGEEVTLVGHR